MPPKQTDRERRQRAAQKALVAIVESSDDPQVKLAELARLRAFLDRLAGELEDAAA